MPDSVDQILTRLQPGKFDATRAANFDIERAKGVLASEFPVERILNFNADARTADFAFASDTPIEHWFGYVILNTEKKNVDLSRVEKGVCPFLVNHRTDQHCGVVVPGSVELGSVIRGTVKFSRSTLGEEIFNDVKDEVRNGTSLGFLIRDLVLVSNNKDEIPVYEATKWTMLENSSASIPADYEKVGAGRSLFEREPPTPSPETPPVLDPNSPEERALSTHTEKQMEKTAEQIAAEAAAKEAATRAAAIPAPAAPAVETRSAEQIAVAEIRGWATELKVDEIATTYLRDCKLAETPVVPTKDGFFAAVRKASPAPIVVPKEDPAAQAQRQGGIQPQNVQLARSLPRYGTLKNFTGEDAAERAHRFGQWILGVRGLAAGLSDQGAFKRAAEFCRSNGIVLRAMSEGVNESGGFLVPEEFGNDLIDLRELYGVFRRSAKMVPMASDTRSDPRRTGGLTAYFAGEGDAMTASDKAWDRVELTAKKLYAFSRYSNELNEDAVINMGDDLAGEIAYAFAVKEDGCGFIGDGTSTYGGMQGVCTKIKGLHATIANIAGLVVGAGNAYSELVLTDFEAVAAKLPVYADTPRAKWYCHKSVYWNVMAKLALAAGGVTGSEIEGARTKRFLGYDVEFVQVMPSVEANSQVCALLGDLSLAASFGSRRDTTIAISEHSRFANDQLEIRGTERFDINVHDVGNASATAGLRVPGPIVGLITAAS